MTNILSYITKNNLNLTKNKPKRIRIQGKKSFINWFILFENFLKKIDDNFICSARVSLSALQVFFEDNTIDEKWIDKNLKKLNNYDENDVILFIFYCLRDMYKCIHDELKKNENEELNYYV